MTTTDNVPEDERWVPVTAIPWPKPAPSPATERARREAEENIARVMGKRDG